jgi:transcriptional regulator GlxA family with amidase domain
MKVAVLNFDTAVASAVAGPFDMFSRIRSLAENMGAKTKAVFEVDIVNSRSLARNKPFRMIGNVVMNNKQRYDLVMIPAMHVDSIQHTLQQEAELIKWVQRQYDKGAEVASMCTGAFLLACTGLLNGKRATIHWMAAASFRQMYPEVKLQDDKVIIDEGRIYSSGAAFSFTSLIIYLIEKFCGREMAIAASKVFMVQIHDSGQDSFAIFNLQHSHEDHEISRVQDFIEKNYDKLLTVNRLAEKFNMSSRTFIRKFTTITGNTPLEYIQRARVEAAKRLLEKGKLTVEQVCMEVGYSDFGFFRNIFKRLTGLTPQEYKKKYGEMFNEAVVG